MKSTALCAIALGSNLGNSLTILEQSLVCLNQKEGITLKKRSHWYLTKAIGPPQPDYLNGCAILEVTLSPEDVLAILLETEQQFHRIRLEKWGPRTLDLDLLLYDSLILDTPMLQIPHPRLCERAFVLVPLAEIAPYWLEPVSQTAIATLLNRVDCSGVQRLSVSSYP